MKINIADKREFIQNFMNPISTLSPMCCIDVQTTRLKTICSSTDNTMCLIADTPCVSEGELKVNIPDIKRLTGVFSCIKTKEVILNVVDNNIKYNDGEFKFSYHLLEDGIIKKASINLTKVTSLEYDVSFVAEEQSLDTLFKGTSFAAATNKVYISTEDNKVVSELGDKTKHNVDNFISTLCSSYEGKGMTKPLPINLDTFRLITYNGCDKVKFSINTTYGILKIDIVKGSTSLTYILSALIN